MSRRTRIALAAAVAALSLAVAVAPASAGKTGPNNSNAKLCQKGGWQSLFASTGSTFASERDCVSYAAQGGTLLDDPLFAGAPICAEIGGTLVAGDGNPIIWECRDVALTEEDITRLSLACFLSDGGHRLDILFPGARCFSPV